MTTTPINHPSCSDDEEHDALHVNEALRRMLEAVSSVKGYEQVGILEAAARVLHESVVSPLDVPSHTNAAVDGYALRGEDLPGSDSMAKMRVVGLALAGKPFAGTVLPGQVVRIMTGAPMPAGSDTVLMQEHVDIDEDYIGVTGGRHRTADNVRMAGENIKRGETVLNQGRYLTPPDVGLIASLGISEIRVKRRPRVALLSTGDEVHQIGRSLGVGGIYDSNRYTLHSALKRLSVKVMDQGIVPDDSELLREALTRAASTADVVISSGGVSVGEADFVKEVLSSIGSIGFWKVAMKPGRPLAFGNIGASTFIGLPGNPVAVMVSFYQFVLPLLEKKMGILERPVIPTLKAKCIERLVKRPGRTEYQRGILERTHTGDWLVRTSGKQGSGILRSMSLANALIILEHDRASVEPGETVEALPFAYLM
ncbi:gephyrin-like molybdotransferase Glp [Methylocaldum sp.]|uniref:molybdopterin molybdotransferase MoeA n=1 Tax=Methylocaldum sp. TaxID=1969727 RepID=UPI002D47FE65|nr:gephyrin-like molybdotransferase Glp [Methylocaldum sp.]HYE34899.1 gephyrin-like molybdotransferase Glp [Methylocaldum sp.]